MAFVDKLVNARKELTVVLVDKRAKPKVIVVETVAKAVVKFSLLQLSSSS